MCSLLHNASRRTLICTRRASAIWLLLPSEFSEEIELWICNQGGIPLPSKSVLSRFRGRMDVAFALVFRDCLWEMVNHGGIAVFAAVDSSESLAHKLAGITR